MDLRDFLARGHDKELFWSLVLEPGWVQAGIWTILDNEAKVLTLSSPVAWEESDLVASVDTALSSAVQNLPPDSKEPNKVVFGVPSGWTESGQIRVERLETLKELCKKLDLVPSGFVSLPEAISFYYKSQEGSPLTAVAVAIGKDTVEVSLFRLGNLHGTSVVARSVSLFEDVVEGLARFKISEPIPSRFIIYDGKSGELEEAKQTLIKGGWQELTNIRVLHTPKIEVLDSDRKVEAVCLGGATEIGKVTKIEKVRQENKQPSETQVNSQSKVEGFVLEDDISQRPKDLEENKLETEQKEEPKRAAQGLTKRLSKVQLPKVAPIFSSLKGLFEGGKRPVVLGVSAFILVFALLFAFWWFYPKATVTIFIAPQRLEEKVSVLVNTKQTNVDFEGKVIPGKIVNTKQEGDKTSATSGTKLVGEKAKGEVEIRNGRADVLELEGGTILVASNSLEFVLEKDASIPAQESPGTPGAGKVNIVASDIGSEYNLPKDERFKVSNYPKAEVDAIATSDLTGGASREIRAVSKEDQNNLLEELAEELKQKGADTLKTQIADDEFFIEEATTADASSQNFSAKIGDEAEELKLTLSVDVSGLVVSKPDLFQLARDELREKPPEGYVLRESQVEYEFSLKEAKKDSFELEGTVVANLLPEVNPDDIAKEITGKYPSVAQERLMKIPGFTRAQISISPRFPGKLGSLPRVTKNITVEIAASK